MRTKLHNLRSVLEAPLTHIQPVGLPAADQILGVEGRIPWLDVEVSQHDIGDIGLQGGFVRCLVGRLEAARRGRRHVGDCHAALRPSGAWALSFGCWERGGDVGGRLVRMSQGFCMLSTSLASPTPSFLLAHHQIITDIYCNRLLTSRLLCKPRSTMDPETLITPSAQQNEDH